MGGLDQVALDTTADFENIKNLDPKLWAALSCPVKGLEFDERTLALMDSDQDGRIRVPEIIQALDWTKDNLKDLAVLRSGDGQPLPLAQIKDETVAASAREILKNLGNPDAATISVADAADTMRIFTKTRLNGDGIIPPEAAEDADTRQAIVDMIAVMGGETDRSGNAGISLAKVEKFFADAAALTAWWNRSRESSSEIQPLGEKTQAACVLVGALRAKIDDYFARCRLAAFDPRAMAALNRQESEYLEIAAKDLTITAAEVAGFPLAKIEPNRPLPFFEGINPAWADKMAQLRDLVVEPMLGKGKTALTQDEWLKIVNRLAPFDAWMASKPASPVERLGIERLQQLVSGAARTNALELIKQDLALEPVAKAIASVERLARYYRDLYRLLHNFVNLADFYSPDRLAIFQVGTLYLDGRATELCVRVDDMGKHAALASLSKLYLVYCDCTRPGGEKMTIAAAVTNGDSDNLMPGRNGLFFDRKGRDWEATVTKIIENPISVRQAFWAPYKKMIRMIEDQIEKFAAAKEKSVTENVQSGIVTTAATVEAPPPPKEKDAKAQAFDIAKYAGIFAAIGLAVGAIGTALAAIVGAFWSLELWQMPLAVAGILLIVSSPSMIIAWLKLRQRNLGPILDANGWAINGRVKITLVLGRSLTTVAELPPGATRSLTDPYQDKKSVWPYLLAMLAALGVLGYVLYHEGLLLLRWFGLE